MSEPHAINLSTAWEPPAEGSRAWVRRFGRPSGIAAGTRIWLVIEGEAHVTIVLNGVRLPVDSVRHDVTDLLEARNELLLVPSRPAPAMESDTARRAPAHGRCDLHPQYGKLRIEIDPRDGR